MSAIDPEIVRKVRETRAAQGLPPVVTDPATLDRVAELFRLADKRTPPPDDRKAGGAA